MRTLRRTTGTRNRRIRTLELVVELLYENGRHTAVYLQQLNETQLLTEPKYFELAVYLNQEMILSVCFWLLKN